jgi:hypothetical protein
MKNRLLSLILIFLFQISISGNLFSQTQTWSKLETGLSGVGNVMAFYQGELYVGGNFSTAGSVTCSNIAKWDGHSWSAIGTGTNGAIDAMTVYNNELYVGGTFSTAGGITARKIAKWNGTSWDSVGHGIFGVGVYALAIYNGKLCAGGNFVVAGNTSVKNVAKWDGSNWSAMGNGLELSYYYSYPSQVNSFIVFDNKLIAGGLFDIAGADSTAWCIASWNDISWSHFGEGVDGSVYAFSIFNSELFAGGWFSHTGNWYPVHNLVKWNGNNWVDVGTGTDNAVRSLFLYGNLLYVSGDFTNAGGTSANYIASYDGTSFPSLGTGMDTTVNCIIADDGIVYATGKFTHAGGNPASKIAKWSDAGVGMNNLSENQSALLFPNPSNGIFSVVLKDNFHNSEIEIYNSLGEKISDVELKDEKTTIDLSNEAKGIYFYQILTDGKVISEGKLITR